MPDGHATTLRTTPATSQGAALPAREEKRRARGNAGENGRAMQEPARAEASSSPGLLCGDEPGKQWIALARSFERGPACRGELVILPRRSLLGVGDRLALPVRANEFCLLEAPHGGINGSAGQAGHGHDAESVNESGVDRLQHQSCGVRELWLQGHDEL